MRRLRPWLYGIFILLLFAEIWLGFPIKLENPDNDASEKPLAPLSEANEKMKVVDLVESRGGVRDWEVFADAADGYQGKGKWQLKNVKIVFYSKNEHQFTVTGQEAEIDTLTKDMRIEGHVKTVSTNGYQFESPILLYMAKQRILQSPAPVKMMAPKDDQGEGLVVTSNFMRTDVEKSDMNLDGEVVAQKKMKSGLKCQIKSEKAHFSGLHYQAEFTGQVVMEYGAMKLQSPEASFQYKSATNRMDMIQLKGGVKLNDLDKFATADLVRIEPDTNRIVLSGQPRVVQDQDEIVGDQIVFLDGGKKVKIENMRARVEKAPGDP